MRPTNQVQYYRDLLRLVGAAALILAFYTLPGCGDDTGETDAGQDMADTILSMTLLQTSDMHHHASGYGPFGDYTPLDTGDADPVLGGYARLATLIAAIREEQEQAGVPVLLVDSGDFTMGTVYDLTAQDPLAFKIQVALGYDVVTLGNHEFDWGPAGLTMLIENSLASTPPYDVPIVASNTVVDTVAPEDDGLEALLDDGTIVDRWVVELDNGLKVGFIGLLGKNADDDAATAPPVTFNHEPEFLQAVVDDLKNNQGVHLVIALAHVGMDENLQEGEDFDLAQEVTGIDVIASGHTHLATDELIAVGDTLIFEPGSYGRWLARLDLQYNLTQRRIESSVWDLIPIDDTIAGDPPIQQMVDQARQDIDELLEDALDVQTGSPVAELDFPLPRLPMVETGLGNLCADAVRNSATLAVQGGDDPTPVTVAVIPNGIVRSEVHADSGGIVRFSDLFNILPLGMTPDPANQDIPGWPLVSVYLNASELHSICEITPSLASALGDNVYLNLSGLRYEYDPEARVVQRVKTVYLCGNTLPAASGGDGDLFSTDCSTVLDLEDETTLYRVVTDLYTLLMMDLVTVMLPLAPKQADGTPIDLADPESYLATRLDIDPATTGIQEIKAWVALFQFVRNLPDDGGDPSLPDIPEAVYGEGGSGLGRSAVIEPE